MGDIIKYHKLRDALLVLYDDARVHKYELQRNNEHSEKCECHECMAGEGMTECICGVEIKRQFKLFYTPTNEYCIIGSVCKKWFLMFNPEFDAYRCEKCGEKFKRKKGQSYTCKSCRDKAIEKKKETKIYLELEFKKRRKETYMKKIREKIKHYKHGQKIKCIKCKDIFKFSVNDKTPFCYECAGGIKCIDCGKREKRPKWKIRCINCYRTHKNIENDISLISPDYNIYIH
jgi:hypothetical protein